jgi:hypothetical protein
MSKQPVCDRDCFNCVYADCIDNGMDSDELRQSAVRDRAFARRTSQQKKDHATYVKNREKRLSASKAWAKKNRAHLAAYLREYRRQHPGQAAEWQRNYYAAHREELLAKRKAYYQANREKIIARQKAYVIRKKGQEVDGC